MNQETVAYWLRLATDRRATARRLFRIAAKDPVPPHWGIEHKATEEGRRWMRDARQCVIAAQMAKAEMEAHRDAA